MDLPTRLILQNSAWAADTSSRDPALFRQLAEGQQPQVLWIGCCDSRVPAERVTNAVPGELFVHRSIANLVSADDASVMSALQYALEVLKVAHVIVCGHEACGGVRASLLPPAGDESAPDNYLARHIRPLRNLYRRRSNEIDQGIGDCSSEEGLMARTNRLVALNVSAQVQAMAAMPLVRSVWQRGQPLTLHGWVYGLRDGKLRPLLTIDSESMAHAA